MSIAIDIFSGSMDNIVIKAEGDTLPGSMNDVVIKAEGDTLPGSKDDLVIKAAGDDTSISDTEAPQDLPARRGVKHGTKRGKYRRTGEEKQLVLDAFFEDDSGDWREVAAANGVSFNTAYGWIRRSDEPPKRRGGGRYRKITEYHVDKLFSYLKEKPKMTLKELSEKLKDDTGVSVSYTTVHKHLQGLYRCRRDYDALW